MFNCLLKKILGSRNDRIIKKMSLIVEEINFLEEKISKLTNAELAGKTDEFKKLIKQGKTLDELLPESFAVVRETAKRTIGMRHFDVQLIGGIALHRGMIAEMVTGEGKTLVATLPAYLNALTQKGVHVITVNDYLAKRDREWMGPVYEFLGMTVGVIQSNADPEERKTAYGCDIVYGTNNEFGFDYLRDNMAGSKHQIVQSRLHYAILDEVDSILIDEARTPLIISGAAEESTDKYYKINRIISKFKKGSKDEATKEETGDYIVDEKHNTVYLTEKGEEKAAELLGVDSLHNLSTMDLKHHINQALKAHELFKKDKDYVVKDGKILIVDEFTGRLMPGRRWSDGLHQAVEAKENVTIERENQTLATVTFQNFFKMYAKLSGMTGTAETESEEFSKIYNLEVLVVPTNKPLIRKKLPDVIFKTEKEKFNALVSQIKQLNDLGRPVLVGTISIEKSEILSEMLKIKGIKHNVLNAKYHEKEAWVVAQAGRYKAVTIATNMAGRGTDILLGGNPEFLARTKILAEKGNNEDIDDSDFKEACSVVKCKTDAEHDKVVELGGLHILGTERHESRRIDNQLRGRAGRQGDPGSSQFFLSLEDDLMRIFGSGRIIKVYERLGIEEGQQIQHPLITKAIESAQRRVENQNFQIRKQLLEYDNVMNRQREEIYRERRLILLEKEIKEHVLDIISDVVGLGVELYAGSDNFDDWDFDGLCEYFRNKFQIEVESVLSSKGFDIQTDFPDAEKMKNILYDKAEEIYNSKEKEIGRDKIDYLSRIVLLHMIDSKWKEHLYAMDNLREGIGLRAYGQRDPLIEYQHEGYGLFIQMADNIKEESIETLIKISPASRQNPVKGVFDSVSSKQISHSDGFLNASQAGHDDIKKHIRNFPGNSRITGKTSKKVGRNDPCPCGSGKKYKKCCGK